MANVNVETFGLKLHKRTALSPLTYQEIAGVTALPQLFSFTRNTIDVSEISSDVKEFRAGSLDPGDLQMDLKFDPSNSTHDDTTGLISDMLTRGTQHWVLEIPPSDAPGAVTEYMEFDGVVTDMSVSGAQDDVVRASVTIKISGQPTFTSTNPGV